MNTTTQQAANAIRAAVVTRQSSGDGNYLPVCVYLLSCDVDENGAAIIPTRARNAPNSVRVVENKKATRRLSSLVERAELLANKVNANELTFSQASFDLEYGNY